MQSYKLFGTTRLARGFHITKKKLRNPLPEFFAFFTATNNKSLKNSLDRVKIKKEKILMYNEVHEFSPFAILAHQTVKVQDLELIA